MTNFNSQSITGENFVAIDKDKITFKVIEKHRTGMVSQKLYRNTLRELFITKFKSRFKRGPTKVVVTRAGRSRESSQGEDWRASTLLGCVKTNCRLVSAAGP